MTSRPLITVYDPVPSDKAAQLKKIPLPAVFTAPIRLDIVQFVHSNLAKNRRQATGVDPRQGHKHSAESWGTGRAVSRIPRVSGSGTHRSGQAAFGNMCRKGRMFAPLKIWRRWQRRVNNKQKRHAVASAIAASAIVPLVLARGHRISNIAELPLVFDDKIENFDKTKQAVDFLKRVGAYDDVKKVIDTKKIRAGVGKIRNRRYHQRKGPLFVYCNENVKLLKAVRNIPGVDICNVNRLNLLQLAPGGQLGRFIIWTQTAFSKLNSIFGTFRYGAIGKQDYNLQRPFMTNADLARIINSNEVQEAVTPAKQEVKLHTNQKKNPFRNDAQLFKLDPNAKLVRETARKAQDTATKARQEIIAKKRAALTKDQKKEKNAQKKKGKQWLKNLNKLISEYDAKAIAEEEEWNKPAEVYEGEELEEIIGGADEEEEEAVAEKPKDAKEAVGKDGKPVAAKEGEKPKEGEKGKEAAKDDKHGKEDKKKK